MTVKLALRMHEDSLCRCGHSMRLTQAEDAPIAYRGSTLTCHACAAAEHARESGAGKFTVVEDLRDTPGAMDLDADDIRWMPPEGTPMDVRYQPSPVEG